MLWLEQTLGIRPLICGIGTRRQGFFINPEGVAASQLTNEPFALFQQRARPVASAEACIAAGKACGVSLLVELTALNPYDGQPALTHMRTALQAGMDVVTANKGPI